MVAGCAEARDHEAGVWTPRSVLAFEPQKGVKREAEGGQKQGDRVRDPGWARFCLQIIHRASENRGSYHACFGARAPHACIVYASAPSVLPARSASDGIPRKTLSLALRAGIGSLREMVACAMQA